MCIEKDIELTLLLVKSVFPDTVELEKERGLRLVRREELLPRSSLVLGYGDYDDDASADGSTAGSVGYLVLTGWRAAGYCDCLGYQG